MLINVLLLGGRGHRGSCWSHGGEMARGWLRGEGEEGVENSQNSQSLRCGGTIELYKRRAGCWRRGEIQRFSDPHCSTKHGECASGTSYSAGIALGTWVQYRIFTLN
jgi:hypothetical protein